MYWHGHGSRPMVAWDVLSLPATAKPVSQEEIDALEKKRLRRLRELGDWRPSTGWKIEPRLAAELATEC